jgi:hypothetical protein
MISCDDNNASSRLRRMSTGYLSGFWFGVFKVAGQPTSRSTFQRSRGMAIARLRWRKAQVDTALQGRPRRARTAIDTALGSRPLVAAERAARRGCSGARAATTELRHEIATLDSCAAQNYSRAAVFSALAHELGRDHDLRNCSIGAWLLTCAANGDADGAD